MPDSAVAPGCGIGLSACGASCVDLQTAAEHCGTCEHACASGALCAEGMCVVPPMDCRVDGPCPRNHYCDIGDGTCRVGCVQDHDCGDHEACDTATRTCGCAEGFHDCAGACSSNASPATCGDRCTPCTTPDHADGACDGQSCGFTCQVGYDRSGDGCALRPWTAGTELPDGRIDGAATTGSDGRIYVVGGFIQGGFGAAMVYTPSTDRWTSFAFPSTARALGAAATGSDGRVYLIGGLVASAVTGSAEVYSPSTDRWATLPAMPTARENAGAAASADGRIFVMGGDNFPGTDVYSTVEVYSPRDDAWTTAAPMPIARTGHAVVAVGGTIYAIGGDFGGTMDAYDPSTNTWSARAALKIPRRVFAAAAGRDGRIYVMGGIQLGGTPTTDPLGLSSVEVYTPATDSWSTIGDLPTGRFELMAATGGDGRLYAIGGRIRFSSAILSTVEVFQP
ncbi:MAG TPA: kelch repeat-containing protein [Kofleriaceae bacterium]|nr:kelch repeat-containing protein [Kofleriaceae bacterium]